MPVGEWDAVIVAGNPVELPETKPATCRAWYFGRLSAAAAEPKESADEGD